MFNFVRINAVLVAGIDLTKAPHFKLTSDKLKRQAQATINKREGIMAIKIFKPSLRKKINLPFYKGYIIIKPINLLMRRCLELIGFKTW